MFGVLVDVSGSMRSAYSLDRSHDANVERTHAVLTSIMSIVKQEVIHHERKDSIFVSAFGLDHHAETCDLLRLLDFVADSDTDSQIDGQEELIKLAISHKAPHAKPWIIKHLSQFEARLLYKALRDDTNALENMVKLIPSQLTATVASVAMPVTNVFGSGYKFITGSDYYTEKGMVNRSEAYQYAHKLIKVDDTLLSIRYPEPRPVQAVSEMLNDALQIKVSPSSSVSAKFSSPASSSLHDRIQDLLEPIKPYIYGGTPMRKALTHAKEVFEKENAKHAVLFLLSDGMSGDGDPRRIAQELHELGVTIVTCFLTAHHIDKPKCLYDPDWKFPGWEFPDWKSLIFPDQSGRDVLFDMSSSMQNTHTPISYLVDAGWELPPSGESRLFLQANSLDVVNEFCEILVSQMTKSCDAIVNLLHKVPLATYINQKNAEFEPKEQEGGTCYANAIAAVFHLAMHRIVGREGGVPPDLFYKIRKRIINEYGVKGANTEKVLERVCPEYRLHFQKVDETKARQAIHKRRPVIARFSLYKEQWNEFRTFYRMNPKNVLNKSDITSAAKIELRGHAVVLIRCDSKCLTFMNSWGQNFADGGFFRVKDSNVLNDMTFFDVYWTEQDLKPTEIQAYERECTERAKELLHTFPSLEDLPYECPKCNENTRVGDYLGHILEAECPKCHEKFTPTNKEIMQSLYSHNRD